VHALGRCPPLHVILFIAAGVDPAAERAGLVLIVIHVSLQFTHDVPWTEREWSNGEPDERDTPRSHKTAASLVASSELAKLPGEAESPGSFSGLGSDRLVQFTSHIRQPPSRLRASSGAEPAL
jgi:hypothetical protein